MFKRISIYLHEMYPVWPRLLASIGLFAGIYITAASVGGVKQLTVNYQEAIGVFTVFALLLSLRIADEFKDAKTDLINFPKRPLPSGRVKRGDLTTLAVVVISLMVILNVCFMPNTGYFMVLIGYACLMSVWFFAKKYLQPNLLLTLVTHNPVQLILVWYVISIAALKYHFPAFSADIILVGIVFYLPALIWEISRKIRAPKEENQYVTYSRIFGRRRAIAIVMVVTALQLVLASIVFWTRESTLMIIGMLGYVGYAYMSLYVMKNPTYMNFGSLTRTYLFAFQALIIVVGIFTLL